MKKMEATCHKAKPGTENEIKKAINEAGGWELDYAAETGGWIVACSGRWCFTPSSE